MYLLSQLYRAVIRAFYITLGHMADRVCTPSLWLQRLSNQARKAAVKNETTKTVSVLFYYLSPPSCLSVSPKTVVISSICLALCTKPTISLSRSRPLFQSHSFSLTHNRSPQPRSCLMSDPEHSSPPSPFLSLSLFYLKIHPIYLFISV